MNAADLKKLRESHGLTQKELADICDCSQQWIALLEDRVKISACQEKKIRAAVDGYLKYRETLHTEVRSNRYVLTNEEIQKVTLQSIRTLNERVSLRALLDIPDVHKYIHSRLQAVCAGVASENSLVASQARPDEVGNAT